MLGGAALFDSSAPPVYKILFPKDPKFHTPLRVGAGSKHPLFEAVSPRQRGPCRKTFHEEHEISFISDSFSS